MESALSICFAADSAEEPLYLIQLPNRCFTPKPGIDPALRERLAKSQIFQTHGLVQLTRKPTTADRATLSQAGIC